MKCGQCGSKVKNNGEECGACGCYVTTCFFAVRNDDFYSVKAVADTVDYLNKNEIMILLNLDKKSKRIMIDLTGVKFIDSMGIGELVTISNRQGYTNQEICFVIEHDSVWKSLESLGLHEVLNLRRSVKDVLGAWNIGK